jgi:hypothetical protein
MFGAEKRTRDRDAELLSAARNQGRGHFLQTHDMPVWPDVLF